MANTLSELSEGLAAAAATAGAHVVRVEGRRRGPASGIVWSADGVIVTTHHAVERDDGITLGLPDGETASATLVGRDPTTDVAVLRTEAKELTAPHWAGPDDLRVGHLALALGRPGRSVRATFGIVSAVGGPWRTPVGAQLERYWQPDVTMYPGFSGGPLVNAAGEVTGMNTTGLSRSATITVAPPDLQRVVEALLTHGRVRRGYLGITVQPARLPEAVASRLGQDTGLLVMAIEPGSTADRAGLYLGDVLVGLDAEPLRDPNDLAGTLGADRIGQTVRLRVLRSGQVQELDVTVGER